MERLWKSCTSASEQAVLKNWVCVCKEDTCDNADGAQASDAPTGETVQTKQQLARCFIGGAVGMETMIMDAVTTGEHQALNPDTQLWRSHYNHMQQHKAIFSLKTPKLEQNSTEARFIHTQKKEEALSRKFDFWWFIISKLWEKLGCYHRASLDAFQMDDFV